MDHHTMKKARYRYCGEHPSGFPNETLEEWRKGFGSYILSILEYTNAYGGKRIARIIPMGPHLPMPHAGFPDIDSYGYRHVSQATVEMFVTGVSLDVIETLASKLWMAVRPIYVPHL